MTRQAWDVAADAVASPQTACVLAAGKLLADSASAPYGSVGRLDFRSFGTPYVTSKEILFR